ncbi:hypothetical protein GCM10009557_14960 [Virgisporangium ochraceum]|uniref:Phage integrase central domain-containing protein n=1 Tax=Virgisporangium ochraceum TaxID=65505 RepID=A0A8J3ZQ84_9ACTN|nr:site-specific integrase [Virgisporangium ochraceum]GIJ66285.1 hypothetical protein Voc01_012020 [Virgisporangium ochraceum]
MGVDDLWYLSKRGPGNKRIPSQRHGRGKRYRVRYQDAAGERREKLFDLKRDADDWDLTVRTGPTDESKVDQSERLRTFREYGERWRLCREVGWAVETRKRVESNLRCNLYPQFGDSALRAITLTDVLEWLTIRLAEGTPKTSLKLYFELFDAVLTGAVADKVIPDNPCDNIKMSKILRGLSRAPKWVPTEDQVLKLIDNIPRRYKAVAWLGAGQACRLGEALGMEDTDRCIDRANEELNIVQQLRYSPKEHGGFYLGEPKAGSSGTIDLDSVVAEVLADHVSLFPPLEIELPDLTSGEPVHRTAQLMISTTRGNPFTDRTWSREWAGWRDAAGWPTHGTFHSLRQLLRDHAHYEPRRPEGRSASPTSQVAGDHVGDLRALVAASRSSARPDRQPPAGRICTEDSRRHSMKIKARVCPKCARRSWRHKHPDQEARKWRRGDLNP